MRLDEWLVQNGLFKNVRDAQAAVLAGKIRNRRTGMVLDKAGTKVSKLMDPELMPDPAFVSRGGEKLRGLLDELSLTLQNKTILDIGSSTGGFVDCFLQAGAARVFALDVGRHQLHEKLRLDSRVELFEQQDARQFDFSRLSVKPDWISIDVSFISLRKILERLSRVFPTMNWILLFKPQFEVGKFVPKKRGVAPQKEADKALKEMLRFLPTIGLNPKEVRPSQIKGAKGNEETFIVAQSEFPSWIFRSYDIRGEANRDLPNPVVERIGMALGQRIAETTGHRSKVGIGRDARLSSPRIRDAILNGLSLHRDLKIFDLGEIPTPMAYFANYHFGLDAVVQITASHNPKDDNGMKMMLANNTLFGDEILSLGKQAFEINFPLRLGKLRPISVSSELKSSYLKFLQDHTTITSKRHIVLDCGNGMAGVVARDAFLPYAHKLDILFEDVDCRFPHHEADPTVEKNLAALRKKVIESSADIGFGFDGDGDRLGLVTKKGRILFGDEILMLLAEGVLRESPGATIIGEVKCSSKLFRMIEARGGKPLMYKAGHSLIKKKMKELGAPLAGEMSGHLFFADRAQGYDDAIYAALRVLEVINRYQIDIDSWIESFPASFVSPEWRVPWQREERTSLVTKVRDFFDNQSNVDFNDIDGLRATFSDGSWILIRPSNTQDVVVMRLEAPSRERLDRLQRDLENLLGRSFCV